MTKIVFTKKTTITIGEVKGSGWKVWKIELTKPVSFTVQGQTLEISNITIENEKKETYDKWDALLTGNNKTFELEFAENDFTNKKPVSKVAKNTASKASGASMSASQNFLVEFNPENKELRVDVSFDDVKLTATDKLNLASSSADFASQNQQDNGTNELKKTSTPNQPETPTSLPEQTPPPKKDIDNEYNQDPQKEEIKNNPKFSTDEEKNHVEQLLKDIIALEILSSERKYNQELLDKLLHEKNSNSKYYQELNNESRIDLAIALATRLQKDAQKAQSTTNNNNSQGLETYQKVLIGGGIALVVVVIIFVIMRRVRAKKVLES